MELWWGRFIYDKEVYYDEEGLSYGEESLLMESWWGRFTYGEGVYLRWGRFELKTTAHRLTIKKSKHNKT